MKLRPLLIPLIVLSLTGCSAEDRAERRAKQIEAEVSAKAEAGTLTMEEFGRAMDEMADLADDRPPVELPPPPTAEEIRAAQQKLNQDLARNIAETNARLNAPPRPIEEIRADATAETEQLERLHAETLNRLAELERADRSQRRYATNTASLLRLGWSDFQERQTRQIAADDWRVVQRAYDNAVGTSQQHERHLKEANARLSRRASRRTGNSHGWIRAHIPLRLRPPAAGADFIDRNRRPTTPPHPRRRTCHGHHRGDRDRRDVRSADRLTRSHRRGTHRLGEAEESAR